MKSIVIKLDQEDIGNEKYICEEIGRLIDEGYTSGMGYPVNWSIEDSERVEIN